MDEQCARVNRWLRQAHPLELPDDLVRHVRGCARCRGRLALFAADLVRLHPALADVDEDDIEDQLPAFIDFERAYGPVAAAQTFPIVWWYLLLSPACAASYADLITLHAIPLPSFNPPKRPPLRFPPLVLPITIVQRKLHADQRMGRHWGRPQATIIAEQETESIRVMLSLRREGDQQITLMVQVEPPTHGTAVLHIADLQLRAPFDAAGCAVFPNLDATLFLADGETPLKVVIEPVA